MKNKSAVLFSVSSHFTHIIQVFFIFVSERGKFLALDLGGTNFRVLIINLGENHFDMQSKIYAIPNHIMTGTGVALFDHIAECLANFMVVRFLCKICLIFFAKSCPLHHITYRLFCRITVYMMSVWRLGSHSVFHFSNWV